MNGRPTSVWHEDRVRALRALAAEKLTASEIGDALGLRKNQIIGACRGGTHLAICGGVVHR